MCVVHQVNFTHHLWCTITDFLLINTEEVMGGQFYCHSGIGPQKKHKQQNAIACTEPLSTLLHSVQPKKFLERIGGDGYRSHYLSHAKRALYHLSYTPVISSFPRIWNQAAVLPSSPWSQRLKYHYLWLSPFNAWQKEKCSGWTHTFWVFGSMATKSAFRHSSHTLKIILGSCVFYFKIKNNKLKNTINFKAPSSI